MKRLLILLTLCLFTAEYVSAQGGVGIKANLLYGVSTYTPNLGIEIGLGRRTTLDISGGYNPWNLHNSDGSKKLVHWVVSPEVRYFFSRRFSGHFVGVHGLYSRYNISGHKLLMLFGKESATYRHEGSAYGGGITYGYQFLLGRRWNLELSMGAGVLHLDYDRYDCVNCGQRLNTQKKTYYGPTKAAISLIYIIK